MECLEIFTDHFEIDTNKMFVGKFYGFKWKDNIIGVMKDADGDINWFTQPLTVHVEEEEEEDGIH